MTVPVFGERGHGHTYRLRPAAYAVILDDAHRVACVREESGLFLPGGGIEPGEDAVRAVAREAAEECGWTLEILRPLGTAIQFFQTTRGDAFELHASFFLARVGSETAGKAQLETQWLPALPQPPELYHECHRWAVRRASAGP